MQLRIKFPVKENNRKLKIQDRAMKYPYVSEKVKRKMGSSVY